MTAVPLRPARHAVATLFFVLGFNYGTWASRLPALKDKLSLDPSQVGFLLLASGLGAVFSFPVTAWVLRRLGARTACWITAALLPALLLALGLAPSYRLALLVMALEGVAAACLNVAMNAQAVQVELQGGRAIMSRLHATFSLGGLAAALFASAVTALFDHLALHFLVAALGMWSAAWWAGRRLLSLPPEPVAEPGRRFSLPSGAALWLGAAALCGTVIEGSMSDWSALYLKERAGASEAFAPMGLACFAATMLLARWLGDSWRTRWGSRRLLTWGGLLAGAGLASGLLLGGPVPALLAFALVGLGIAAASPCIYLAAARQGPVALAAITTTGSVGALLGPPLIGFVAHASHLGWGLACVALAAALIALAARHIDW
ncbi:MFS transporter [Chitiniphilus shinanonensis]|uniref:MFS transporter n=1 Tax=Chitiniphilus shinanonensis TaxID=553088 RepID=A0ABQ6BQD9_9NEIS|nr:MFS transporter [Chitiniphilus shinanonensis]GLS03395.1 MFS transporter [Chitiniphilus shinanonensis]